MFFIPAIESVIIDPTPCLRTRSPSLPEDVLKTHTTWFPSGTSYNFFTSHLTVLIAATATSTRPFPLLNITTQRCLPFHTSALSAPSIDALCTTKRTFSFIRLTYLPFIYDTYIYSFLPASHLGTNGKIVKWYSSISQLGTT
jgi:hypothetical protein